MFVKHTDQTAPEGAAQVLAKVRERYGFIPNLAAHVAEAPGVLDAVLSLSGAFEKTSLSAHEQQVVLLTASTLNGCEYCKTVHRALARKSGIDAQSIQAVLTSSALPDGRLNAVRDYTRKIVENMGRVKEADIQAFLDAGFSRAQAFEVVLGVALKTLTNYCNHLVGATPNPEFVAMANG